MQIPYRKPGKFSSEKPDPLMTERKLAELKNNLENLKKKQPFAAAEVSRLAELGDFSENAEYQLAKGRLRGINNAILTLEARINQAVIIKKRNLGVAELGSIVTVEKEGRKTTYQILGSSETNPSKGIISAHSPLGAALMGKAEGERFLFKNTEYLVLKIE